MMTYIYTIKFLYGYVPIMMRQLFDYLINPNSAHVETLNDLLFFRYMSNVCQVLSMPANTACSCNIILGRSFTACFLDLLMM